MMKKNINILIKLILFGLLLSNKPHSFLFEREKCYLSFKCCLIASVSEYDVLNCNSAKDDKWVYFFETKKYLEKICDGLEPNTLFKYFHSNLIFDKISFNLTTYEKFIPLSSVDVKRKSYKLNIINSNIQGFDLNLNLHNKIFDVSTIDYFQTNLQIYNKGILFQEECDLFAIQKLIGIEDDASKNVKIKGDYVTFNKNTIYSQYLCAYFFMNSRVKELTFKDIKNSLIENNQLGFIDLKNADLNCTINMVTFELYRVNIGKKLLNRQIFYNTSIINIRGVSGLIDSDFNIFDWLPNLKEFSIEITNKKEFVELNQNWLAMYIDPNQNNNSDRFSDFKNKNNFIIIHWVDLGSFNGNEMFPYEDENFCLFSKYPVNKTIFYNFRYVNSIDCTCTIAYLEQNYYYNKNITIFNNNICSYYNETEFYEFFDKCNFEKRLKMCNQNETKIKSQIYMNAYDFIQIAKTIKFAFVIIGQPIVSFMGIVLNILILIVLRKRKQILNQLPAFEKRNSEKSEITFEYIETNSIVNLTASIVYSFQLLIDCVNYSSIYCSKFYFTQFGRLFYLYFINFLGSSLKTSSCLTTLIFSLTRYLMIAQKDHLFKCIPIFKLKPKLVLLAVLIISLCLNIVKIFFNERQYYVFTPFKDTDQPDLDYGKSFESDYDKIRKNYNFISIINFIINDILTTFLIIVIDSLILVKIRSTKLKINNRSVNKKQLKLNKLIIYNGLFQFLFKLPDMIFNILHNYHFYISADKWEKNLLWYCDVYPMSRENSICLNLLQSTQFFYILSFSVDFFLLYKFNTHFKNVFFKNFRLNKI